MTALSHGPEKNQVRTNQSSGNCGNRLLDELYVYGKIKCLFTFTNYFESLAKILTLLKSITQRSKMGITS